MSDLWFPKIVNIGIYNLLLLPYFVSAYRHSALAKKLKHWSHSSLHFYARLYYWLYFFLPGLSLLLAMVAFCQLQQPIGLLVAVVCVLGGFFYPMSYHRTTHVSALPNPALYGALISGLIHTAVCYFIVVRPRILQVLSLLC